MKFFKQTPDETDGYSVLIDNLQQTGAELRIAYDNLQNVVEPDLIDYYIYQTKAVQMRYKFLLDCVKKLEVQEKQPTHHATDESVTNM